MFMELRVSIWNKLDPRRPEYKSYQEETPWKRGSQKACRLPDCMEETHPVSTQPVRGRPHSLCSSPLQSHTTWKHFETLTGFVCLLCLLFSLFQLRSSDENEVRTCLKIGENHKAIRSLVKPAGSWQQRGTGRKYLGT